MDLTEDTYDSRLIIFEAVFDTRCLDCKHRDRLTIKVPVSPVMFFEDRLMLDQFVDHEFSPTEAKVFASKFTCANCEGRDFEIGLSDRMAPYRDGDPLRSPVVA